VPGNVLHCSNPHIFCAEKPRLSALLTRLQARRNLLSKIELRKPARTNSLNKQKRIVRAFAL